MITPIPYPPRSTVTVEDQTAALTSYMFQLTDSLNFALSEIERRINETNNGLGEIEDKIKNINSRLDEIEDAISGE